MHRFGDLVPSLGATIAARTAIAQLRTWCTFGQKVTFPLKPGRQGVPVFRGGCANVQNFAEPDCKRKNGRLEQSKCGEMCI